MSFVLNSDATVASAPVQCTWCNCWSPLTARGQYYTAKLRLVNILDLGQAQSNIHNPKVAPLVPIALISPGPQHLSFNELAPDVAIFFVSGLWQYETPNVMSCQVDTVLPVTLYSIVGAWDGRWWGEEMAVVMAMVWPPPDLWSHNNFPLPVAAVAWRGWRRRGEWRIPGI